MSLTALRQHLRFGPLKRRLFITVFAGLMPLAILSFWTLLYQARDQRRQLLQAAQDTLRAIVTAADAELEESIAALDALAASPRLASDDFAGFRAEARELLLRRPDWANVVLSLPSSEQVMNAYQAPDAALPRGIDQASVDEAVRTKRPGAGNMTYSPAVQRYALAVWVPILRNGEVAYVLFAAIRPESMLRLLARQRVPEQGVVGIADRNYNLVARSLHHDAYVGRPFSPTLVALLEQGKREGRSSGFGITSTLESTSVYTAYYRSSYSGWTGAIGIPRPTLDAPIKSSYEILASWIMLSALAGLAVALLVGRSITTPMRELKRAAAAVGGGRAPERPTTRVPEIRQVWEALAAAHVEREKLLQSEREARLREQEARLLAEKASRTKDEFLAMLGHELRNPLAAISSASRLLDYADRVPKEAVVQARAIIQRQVRHLTQLTDDLLDAGRVIMDKVHLERRPVELAAIVQGALDTLRDTGRLADHRVEASLAPVWVNADATRIDQVIGNLLTNAVKYTPSPGSIRVSVARDGDHALVRIRDSGLGIEPELLPRIFELFVQGRRSLDRAQGGLGIGLTLVRRLTELHGGRVEAASAGPGQGSEFSVRLPAIDPPAPQRVKPPVDTRVEPRSVVIVEDNHDLRATLRQLLELAGHTVHEASDGPSGVETVLREQADLALIDIGLPLLDGYAVARELRVRAPHGIRLVAMTGYGSTDDAERGLSAGFDAYLVKPVDPDKLLALVAGS